MTLIELLSKNKNYSFNSDPGTDKESQHYYVSSFYDRAFLPYKEKEVNVLEIGINTGGSLLLWKDYFTKGKIFGVDVNNCLSRPIEEFSKIYISFEDGYTQNYINKTPGFDIIIDDGPHTLHSQIQCLNLFLPKLKTNGLLVIEDIEDIEYIKEFNKIISKLSYSVKTEIVDTREQYNQFDNIIFAVWKL